MIKADLVNIVSRELNISKQEAEVGVNLFFEAIKEAILKGEEIEFRGFGSFRFRQRAPGPVATRGPANWSRFRPRKCCTSSHPNC